MTVAVDQHDVARPDDCLYGDLVRGGGAVGAEEELAATEGARGLFLRGLDVACRFEQGIQTARGGGRLGKEDVGAVEVSEVPDPVRIEDRFATGHRQGVEGADRTAGVILQVVEVGCLVAAVDAVEQRQVQFHQVLHTVENPADVRGVEVARHLLHRSVDDEVNVEFGADFPDGAGQGHTVVPRFERTIGQAEVLFQVLAQQRGVEPRTEEEVILDDDGLDVRIEDRAEHRFLKTGNGDDLIDKRILRAAELAQLGPRLTDLLGSRVIGDIEDLEVWLGEVARVEIVLEETVVALALALLAEAPGIERAPVGAGDDGLGDAVGDAGQSRVVLAGHCFAQCLHHRFTGVGVKILQDRERSEQRFRLGRGLGGGGSLGGGLGGHRLAGVCQFLPPVGTGFACAEHAYGVTGGWRRELGGFFLHGVDVLGDGTCDWK